MTLPRHLVLTFHGVRNDGLPQPLVYPELHIPVSAYDDLFSSLSALGYHFCFPSEVYRHPGKKTCSVTFDDGYFNNSWILPTIEKYEIPLMVFVATSFIRDQKPFIWDVMATSGRPWSFRAGAYEKLYETVSNRDLEALMTDQHRPMTVGELKSFVHHPLVKAGLHSHTHEPFLGRDIDRFSKDLSINEDCLSSWLDSLDWSPEDFAFPNGLSSIWARRWAKRRFRRLYSIDPIPMCEGQSLIGRISLVQSGQRTLIEQIERGYSWRRRGISFALNLKQSVFDFGIQ